MDRRGVRALHHRQPVPVPAARHRHGLQHLLAAVRAHAAAAMGVAAVGVGDGGEVGMLALDARAGDPEVQGPDAAVCERERRWWKKLIFCKPAIYQSTSTHHNQTYTHTRDTWHAPQHRGEQHTHGHASLRLSQAEPDEDEEEGDAQVEGGGEAEPPREELREGLVLVLLWWGWGLEWGGGGVEAAAAAVAGAAGAVAAGVHFGGVGGDDVVEQGWGDIVYRGVQSRMCVSDFGEAIDTVDAPTSPPQEPPTAERMCLFFFLLRVRKPRNREVHRPRAMVWCTYIRK